MKRISITIFILSLFLMQSCCNDDEYCRSNAGLLLRYKYTLNDQYTNLFDLEVNKVTIYLFDDNNKYVGTFSESGEKLTNDYIMSVLLPEGVYRVVVYGGDFNTYSVGELDNQTNILKGELKKGITTLDNFRVMLNNMEVSDGNLTPQDVPDDLYSGFAAEAVSSSDNGKITDIELIKDTKKIKLKISGLDILTRSFDPLDIYITAINGRYKFDNGIDDTHGVFKYNPINTSVTGNNMEANLKIMRLVIGYVPMLVIKDSMTSKLIYNKNIIEQILLNPAYKSQEDIDREDEFLFEIALKEVDNNIVVSVTINGWKINDINPEIQ